MSTRTNLARKAATGKSYAAQLDGSSDEVSSDEEEVGDKRGKQSKGKGKGRSGKNGGPDSSEEEDDEDEPVRKKRKATKGKGKKKDKGKQPAGPGFDLLETMPMDLLVEIFSYLLPSELLALSRASKPYRQLLTSKQSKTIWRRSLRLIEMPDLAAEDMSEMAYAHLVFGKKCEVCGKGRTARPDHYLRVRLCVDCAKDNYVKLDTLHKTHPQYHPLVDEVVNSTPHSASSAKKWPGSARFALRADLDYYSKHLYELQDEDEANLEVASLKPASVSTRSGRPSRSGRCLPTVAEGDTEDEDEAEAEAEDEEAIAAGPLVAAFVKDRKALLTNVNKDGRLLDDKYDAVRRNIRSHQYEFWSAHWAQKRALSGNNEKQEDARNKHEICWERDSALRAKVRQIQDRPHSAFYTDSWRKHELVNVPRRLTDEEWDEIKDDIFDIVEHARVEVEEKAAKTRKQDEWEDLVDERAKEIGARCLRLRDGQSVDFARLAFPRRADFLLFESVKPLHLPEKMQDDFDEDRADLSDEEWNEALPPIEEELNEYRLNLFLHAVKLILSATTEPEDMPDDEYILDNLEEYDEAFFRRATSFLCCDESCYRRNRRSWYWSNGNPGRRTFIGTLNDLLEHQHAEHGDLRYWWGREKKAGPRTHFSLPLEVSCAISALVELGNLDEQTAGAKELDDMDKKGYYEWENAHCKRKSYYSWRDLLDAIYREAKRYAQMKPPRSMDPAVIVFHPRSTKRSPAAIVAEESEEEDELSDSSE